MQESEADYGNQTLVAAPALNLAKPHFIYREAPWIEALLRAGLVASGVLLVVLAWRSATTAPLAFTSLFVVGAGTMIYGAIYLRSRHSPNFICTADGLYFPDRQHFSRSPRLWLFVPWKNVVEYRVRRMLDETSSRGLMLAIRATADEERAFFRASDLHRLSALHRAPADQLVLVGFSTFLPRPETVREALQRFEAGAGNAVGHEPLTWP